MLYFRGFDEYYSIPYGETTAISGHWEKGPGLELFRCMEQRLGWHEVIAEDLGYPFFNLQRQFIPSVDGLFIRQLLS